MTRPCTFLAPLAALVLLLGALPATVHSQNPLLDSIRRESSRERIMETVSVFSDVFGPRLMGTPNYYNALTHARVKLAAQGITTRLESFDRGYRGWSFSSFSVEMSAPSYAPLSAYPLAYTQSTEGIQEGELLFIERLEDAYALEGSLRGKIIMFRSLYAPVHSVSGPMSYRLSDATLTRATANPDPNDVIIGYHSRVSVPSLFQRRETTKERMANFFQFLETEGVVATVEPSDYPYGMLHVDANRAVPSFRLASDHTPIASFVMSNEHFGRLVRLDAMGMRPTLRVELSSQFHTEPEYNQNLVAEIPGQDSAVGAELVMIGAHLDSWHAGTGAVDNAANAALLMEAMRILQALGVQPRRTIRLVLWGGEEQVFAGSEQYVNTRIGDMRTGAVQSEHSRVSAYLNLDNGAGKIRGLYLMGNREIAPFFAEYLEPFQGSNTLTLQNANQTDHWLFDYHNVPAFQFIQDPLDYISATHHTNVDAYEYVPPDDQLFNAELVAYLALQIANEASLLPRKPLHYVQPSRTGHTTLTLDGAADAREVSVVGSFNNWDMFSLPMYRTDTGWETKLTLPAGKYYYKFIVDGQWTNNPSTPAADLARDGKGHAGLTVLYVR